MAALRGRRWPGEEQAGDGDEWSEEDGDGDGDGDRGRGGGGDGFTLDEVLRLGGTKVRGAEGSGSTWRPVAAAPR